MITVLDVHIHVLKWQVTTQMDWQLERIILAIPVDFLEMSSSIYIQSVLFQRIAQKIAYYKDIKINGNI